MSTNAHAGQAPGDTPHDGNKYLGASTKDTGRSARVKTPRRRRRLDTPRHDAHAHRYRTAMLDWPLLHWLLRSPFLGAEDLAAFCGVSASTISRRLRELEERDLIEWVTPACLTERGAQWLYYLSNAGIHLLASSLDTDPARLACAWACDEIRLSQHLPRLSQFVRVQTLIRGLLEGAPRALGEQGREAAGFWHWLRDYRHTFSVYNHSQTLALDAAVAFHVTRIFTGHVSNKGTRGANGSYSSGQECWEPRDAWYAALLLADTRVQDWRAAARSLDSVLSYRESPERWPLYSAFPPLVILAADQRHAERWQQVARACTEVHHLPPLRGAITVIPHPPQLPMRCDPWRLSWRDLTTGAPQHLTAVISGLPRAAVPPGVDGSTAPAPSPHTVTKATIAVLTPTVHVVGSSFTDRMAAATSSLTSRVSYDHPYTGDSSTIQNTHAVLPRDALRLLSLRLGGRLVDALTLLFCAPGIRVVDLGDLLGVQRTTIDRYLSVLHRYGLLWFGMCDPQDDSGSFRGGGSHTTSGQGHLSYNTSTTVSLSVRGHWLVAAMQGIDPRSRLAKSAASPRGAHAQGNKQVEERTYVTTPHNVGVYHFFARLTRAAATESQHADEEKSCLHQQHRLVWWEVGALAERRYRYQGSWHSIRPDGAGCYQSGATRFRFWLEWDQGSMNLSNLIRKFVTYYTFLASGAWRETLDRAIPHLIIVVQSFGQLQRMRKAIEIAYADHFSHVGGPTAWGSFHASTTLADRLNKEGPLAPIWWPLFPDTVPPQFSHQSPSRTETPSFPSSQRIFP